MTAVSAHLADSRRSGPSIGFAEAVAGYSLAAPAFVLLFVFMLAPVVAVFVIALSDWQFGARTFEFVGLDNFREMLTDSTFRASIVNTAIYVGLMVPGTVIVALFLAVVIESGRSFRAFYRAAHFLPVMATLASMSIAWEAMLHPTIGMVNQVLGSIGLTGANWLNDPATVLPVLIVIGIWQYLGFAMVMFLAGLKAIPNVLYDAGEIDGVEGGFNRFRTITLPMLGPIMMLVLIVVALHAFKTFDTVLILTKGGPGNRSELLMHTLYTESFIYFRTGYGAAMTVVFLIIVLVLTLVQARTLDKRVHYS